MQLLLIAAMCAVVTRTSGKGGRLEILVMHRTNPDIMVIKQQSVLGVAEIYRSCASMVELGSAGGGTRLS